MTDDDVDRDKDKVYLGDSPLNTIIITFLNK